MIEPPLKFVEVDALVLVTRSGVTSVACKLMLTRNVGLEKTLFIFIKEGKEVGKTFC